MYACMLHSLIAPNLSGAKHGAGIIIIKLIAIVSIRCSQMEPTQTKPYVIDYY